MTAIDLHLALAACGCRYAIAMQPADLRSVLTELGELAAMAKTAGHRYMRTDVCRDRRRARSALAAQYKGVRHGQC